jgi:hypothetical protein
VTLAFQGFYGSRVNLFPKGFTQGKKKLIGLQMKLLIICAAGELQSGKTRGIRLLAKPFFFWAKPLVPKLFVSVTLNLTLTQLRCGKLAESKFVDKSKVIVWKL